MGPYEHEVFILGVLLNFPDEAPSLVFRFLDGDKFVYGRNALFGDDHANVFSIFKNAWLMDGAKPSIPLIVGNDEDLRLYIKSIKRRVTQQYVFTEFDESVVYRSVNEVDKAGTFRRVAVATESFATTVEDETKFEKFVGQIDDIDLWINKLYSTLQSSVTPMGEGYKPLSAGIDATMERLDAVERGEQLFLLPCGIPAFLKKGIPAKGRLMVLHGLSSSGKTTVAHALGAGTAMGLLKNEIPGCVAFNSLEESLDDILEKLAASLAGFNLFNLLYPDDVKKEDIDRFRKWVEYVGNLPIQVDTTNLLTSSVLSSRITGLHASEHGPIHMLVTDYLELFKDDEYDYAENKEQRLSIVIRRHLDISRVTGASVIAISQSVEGNNYNRSKIAGPSGARGSRGILHAADILAEVWNPIEMENSGRSFEVPDNLDADHMWVLVQKYKKGPKGEPIKLAWEPEYIRVYDPAITNQYGEPVLYTHLEEVVETQRATKSTIIDPDDTSFGGLFND